MGRATKMNTNITSSPPKKYRPSASKGRLIPRVTKTSRVAISATCPRNPSSSGVLVVVAEPQHLHVPDHQAHDEGREVGRPAERLGREVSESDDGEDGHPRRLVPDAGPRRRGDGVAENSPGNDADQGPEHKFFGELQSRTGERESAGLHNAYERQGQHRPTSLKVTRRSVWDHFGAEFQAVEQGDEDGGILADRTAPTSRATGKATPKAGETTSATMRAVRSTPGKTSRPRPTAVLEITCSEMPVPPWNKMRATPMLNRSWAPTPFRGVRDESEHRRPDKGARRDQHDHLGAL